MSIEAIADQVYSRTDLLERLAAAGIRVRMEHGGVLIVEPLSRLTEELLVLILQAKELLTAVLAPSPAPGIFRFPLPHEPDSPAPDVEDRVSLVLAEPGPSPDAFDAEVAFNTNAALIMKAPPSVWPDLLALYRGAAERRYDPATAAQMARSMEAKILGALT